MPSRSSFTVVKSLAAAANGAQNSGVYLVRNKKTGKLFIEKRIGLRFVENGHAKREVKAMKACCSYTHVIRIEAYDLDASRLGYASVFMQHCELGCLDTLITRYSSRGLRLADEGFLWKVFWDCSLALAQMWTGADAETIRQRARKDKFTKEVIPAKRVVHRDLKPSNIFLTWQDPFDVERCPYPTSVIGDFGCSVMPEDVFAGKAHMYQHSGCTPAFMPPEAEWKWCSRGDIYQLGLSIHCLARMDPDPKLRRRDILPGMYKHDGLRKLLTMCCQYDPDNRPVAGELPALVYRGYCAW
ncbi:kinase-like protein, partial [Setomelanomma holmii]